MAKFTGPKCKLSRREKTDLGLKSGVKSYDAKCRHDKIPGQHGGKTTRLSDYGVQLREKQKIRRIYGVLERQFRRFYHEASRLRGPTGLNLLHLLERRLDNMVYRLGFAYTRAEARQLVSHRLIEVNGDVCNVPSRLVAIGDVVTVREAARKQQRIVDALELAQQLDRVPEWVSVEASSFSGQLKYLPERDALPQDIQETLVIELYSK